MGQDSPKDSHIGTWSFGATLFVAPLCRDLCVMRDAPRLSPSEVLEPERRIFEHSGKRKTCSFEYRPLKVWNYEMMLRENSATTQRVAVAATT